MVYLFSMYYIGITYGTRAKLHQSFEHPDNDVTKVDVLIHMEDEKNAYLLSFKDKYDDDVMILRSIISALRLFLM